MDFYRIDRSSDFRHSSKPWNKERNNTNIASQRRNRSRSESHRRNRSNSRYNKDRHGGRYEDKDQYQWRDRKSENMNRSGSRHSRKSSRSRDRSSRYRSSEEVNLINFSEYVFLEPINDSGSNIPVELDSDPEIKFIDHVYKEGNHDIDPSKGIIDSGCPRTVAGRPWLDAYIESKGDITVKNI